MHLTEFDPDYLEIPMSSKLDDVSMNILSNVVRSLGPLWDRRLTESDRALVRACCVDAARLSVKALATPRNREMQFELMREKAHIHAQLCSSVSLGVDALADVFWDGFRTTINGAVTVAFTVL